MAAREQIDDVSPHDVIQNYRFGLGGRTNDASDQAVNAFRDLFGRNPTQQELAQALPSFLGSDPHITDIGSGRAYVANLASAITNSPDRVYARQQQELATKAPQQYGQVSDLIQKLYSRGATQDELDHFGKMLASGQIDPYELQSFLQATPEYQNAQDKTFREGLSSELQGYDQTTFDRAKEDIISRYAQMGRSTSPSLDFALSELAGKIADQRNQYLTSLSASQYQGNKDLAVKNYRDTMDRYFGRQDYSQQRADQLLDYSRQRADEVSDYNRQEQDYMNALSRTRKPGLGGAIGGLIGAGVGAYYGGPQGASAGMGAGHSAGGIFDYLNA